MATVDPHEINTFQSMKNEWWDEKGPLKGLHELNPPRLEFILAQMERPLIGLKILDLGCGGGILSEPLARLGTHVTGIDASEGAIDAATAHAKSMGLDIDYRCMDAQDLLKEGHLFDVVVSMEVIEHVADVSEFITLCTSLLKPGGDLFLSTLNKTCKSWALGIIVAENVLKWAPKGAHDWNKFISPQDLAKYLRSNDCEPLATQGLTYSVFKQSWQLSDDVDINYVMYARKMTNL